MTIRPPQHSNRARRPITGFAWLGAVAVGIGVGATIAFTQTRADLPVTTLTPSLSESALAPPPSKSAPSTTMSPHRPIELSAPLRIAIPDVGIDAPVEEYTNEQVEAADGWVDPPHRDVVAWWSGGGTPGNPADNTVYLYGHVSHKEAVFNDLLSVPLGGQITLTTRDGEVTYEVVEILEPISKEALPQDPRITAIVPGRLVLVGCYREPDQGTRPTTSNTVVIAHQK